MLPDLITQRNTKNSVPIKKVTNVRTICEIILETSVGTEMLSEVIKLLKIFYTVPTTTSTAERSFSALRCLKTYLRSTMTQPRLIHTFLAYIHKEHIDKIKEEDIAESFVSMNDRRKRYFGSFTES